MSSSQPGLSHVCCESVPSPPRLCLPLPDPDTVPPVTATRSPTTIQPALVDGPQECGGSQRSFPNQEARPAARQGPQFWSGWVSRPLPYLTIKAPVPGAQPLRGMPSIWAYQSLFWNVITGTTRWCSSNRAPPSTLSTPASPDLGPPLHPTKVFQPLKEIFSGQVFGFLSQPSAAKGGSDSGILL